MTKKEFEQLKVDLELAISRVNKLQKIYRKETGHDFVPPLRLKV